MNLTDLECTKQIPATPDAVYAAWLDPSCPGSPWYAPTDNGMSSKILFSAAVDGLFYHAVQNHGQTWAHYGRFTRLDPAELVEHTWVGEWTKGRESVVTTTFAARDGGTFLTLRHTGVPDDEQGRHHVQGWNWCLHQLAERLGAKK